jgi:two-component system chemotaxis sensor kinase CheA
MDNSLEQIREVFFEEAREHLESMEACLLELEAGGAADAEILNRIFRAAHTIKGGSGMFGMEEIAHFTHGLENLLDQMRGGKVAMTPALVDVLLRSCDVLKGLLAAAQRGSMPPENVEAVMAAIQGANTALPTEALATETIQPVNAGAMRRWRIRLTPARDVFRRGLDPLLALCELAELGRVSQLRMDTSAVPVLAELNPEENHLSWTLLLESDQPEQRIQDVLSFLHEGGGLELSPVPQEAGVMAASPAAATSTAEPAPPAAPTSEPAPPSASTSESTPPAASAAESGSTIRVDVDLLDRLMNQVGELVLARNQILQFANAADDAALTAASQRLNLITSELQEGVMKTRMQPIGVAWSMMPRLVRDLAQSCGKQIQLEMEGAETELDRTIIEAIKDPLTHLVRNACDHGLEAPGQREAKGKNAGGKLLLRAFHEGGHVIIEIADDGAGIDTARVKSKALERRLITPEQAARMGDREAIHLIFLPGFSTAEHISNISGRGVGMDVVKTNIERIGGTVDLASHAGQGTTVRIKIPLTLAIIPGMVVESGGERFVIPQVSLVELVRMDEEQARERIERIHGAPLCRLRGRLLPLVFLNEILQLTRSDGAMDKDAAVGKDRSSEAVSIVVLQAEDRQFGLVVDSIRDTQEIVVKPLGKQLKGLSAYSGATVMGDGRIALILDVLGLAQLAGFTASGYATETRATATADTEARQGHKQTLLLFRSPGFERMAVPLALVARLEEFPRDRLEYSGGRQVVQYRNRILPLTWLDRGNGLAGDGPPAAEEATADPLQVIVFMTEGRGLGLVVEEILDIIEESVAVRKQSQQRGLLGSAVVGGQVTDFLDLQAVLEESGERWLDSGGVDRSATILVAGASPFTRALVRSSLEMYGHWIVEAASIQEIVDRLERHRIDVVALSGDLEQAQGKGSLLALIRKHSGGSVPVLAFGSGESAGEPNFDAYAAGLDRTEMETAIRKLLARTV